MADSSLAGTQTQFDTDSDYPGVAFDFRRESIEER